MKKSRFTDERIIGFLKQVEGGVPVKDLCRKHGFSDATFYEWRSRLGGLDVSEARLLRELPEHLASMALFAVNTGCRDNEVCGLRWDWQVRVPELDTSVFIIPGRHVKNGDERLVVLNRIAESVVASQRGRHRTHVFVHRDRPVRRMLNGAWLRARTRAELPQVRVHDLKHTFGRRLRAAGVSFEDRQDLLGHRSGRITTHYSGAELSKLIEAANPVCERGEEGRPELVVLRRLSVS